MNFKLQGYDRKFWNLYKCNWVISTRVTGVIIEYQNQQMKVMKAIQGVGDQNAASKHTINNYLIS